MKKMRPWMIVLFLMLSAAIGVGQVLAKEL